MVSDALSAPKPLLSATDPTEQDQKEEQGRGEQFLRFNLAPNTTALLPISNLVEVLTIPIGQIMPIPHMEGWVMGVYNWRGEILWMVDLGHLVGLTPWYQQAASYSTYKAVVLHSPSSAQNQMLGLIVNRIEDIEWYDPDLIQFPPSEAVIPELSPFLRGCWSKSDGEMLAVFDGDAILAAMPKP